MNTFKKGHGLFRFSSKLTRPAEWQRLSLREAVDTLIEMKNKSIDMNPYAHAITSYIGQVSHLLTPHESCELLCVCASTKLVIHTQGVLWLLNRSFQSEPFALSNSQMAKAFSSAVSISKASRCPFHIELPKIFLCSKFVSSLSPSELLDVALAFREFSEDSWVIKRLCFYILRGDFTNEVLRSLFSLRLDTIRGACLQIVHRRLSELTIGECIAFLDLASETCTAVPVTVTSLLQVLAGCDLRHQSSVSILSYYSALSRMRVHSGFTWLRSNIDEEFNRVDVFISVEIEGFLEDLAVDDFCRFLTIFRSVSNQSEFDRIQLRAFVLSDSMSPEHVSKVLGFISSSSSEKYLVAYPAVNRLKKRFYEVHGIELEKWNDVVSDVPFTVLEKILAIFVDFVNSISSFPISQTDTTSLRVIQRQIVKSEAGKKSLFHTCSFSTRCAIRSCLSRIQLLEPSLNE